MNKPEGFAIASNETLTDSIAAMLRDEIETGELPGASWCVVRGGEIVSKGADGYAVLEPRQIPAGATTIYDLASLTKPLVTTPLVLRAAAEGQIRLDDRMADVVEDLASRPGLDSITWIDLLCHRAGFEAWHPLYVHGQDRETYLRALVEMPLAYEPRTRAVYSDLGFVLLFLALERLGGVSFPELAGRRLLEPLNLESCVFNPARSMRARIAATEVGNEEERRMVASRGLSFQDWRDGLIWGEVNDGNSWYVGGAAGNAGLFGDAAAVARLASIWIERNELLPDELRAAAIRCHAESGDVRRGLGWQLRAGPQDVAGPLSDASFGHTGFTGTSVWIDPGASLIIVLLTNRIHPRVRPSRIQQIRRRLNEIVAEVYL